MSRGNVAVIGPSAFVTTFELAGVEGFEAENAEDVINIVHKLLEKKDFHLVILPEQFTNETKQLRETSKQRSLSPIFILIPDFSMDTGSRLEELRTLISSAIGFRINL